jgi:ABC-type nitrate/sulfonate/bicarbonate transport system substrate-binding protein
MDLSRDVKVISSRGTEDSLAFLLAGKVDAAVVSPPFDLEAETQGFHEIAPLGDALDLPYVGLGTNPAYTEQHRPQLVRTIRALLDASKWLSGHPAEARHLAEVYVDTKPEAAERAVGKMLLLLTDSGETTSEGIQQAIDAQARVTNTTIDMKPEQFVDYGALREAKRMPPKEKTQ